MDRLNKIIAEKEKIKNELNDIASFKNEFTVYCEKEKAMCEAKYRALRASAMSFIQKIKNEELFAPFLRRFGSFLTKKSDYLQFKGTIDSKAFDCDSVFDVYRSSCETLSSLIVQCLSNWKEFCADAGCSDTLEIIAKKYNTVVRIYTSLSELSENGWKSKQAELNERYKNASIRINELSAQLEKLENEESRINEELEKKEKELAKLRDKLHFKHDMEHVTDFPTELRIPIGYSKGNSDKTIDITEWDLTKSNTLHVKVPKALEKTKHVSDFIQNILFHFINSYPICSTNWTLCDLSADISLRSLPAKLMRAIEASKNSANTSKIYYKCTEGKEIFPSFGETMESAHNLICDRISATISDILEFNKSNSSATQPLLLVIINGYTLNGCTLGTLEREIWINIPHGMQTGVYFLITEFEEVTNDRYVFDRTDYLQDLEHTAHYELLLGGDELMLKNSKENTFALKPSSEFDITSYSEILKERIEERSNTYIDLNALLQKHKRDSSDFSKTISIPVGLFDNASKKMLSFCSENSSAHMVISGATGSGKSSILQAIVLGGAYSYSPEELEFYLIDLKNGSSFYDKEKGYDYSKLKHVRMMATNCRIQDLRDFIAYIRETRTSNGAKNIIAYNKNRTGSDRMKRTFIIIDEYTMIDDDNKCIDNLEYIARQGREYGVSLILASQNRSSPFMPVINHITNRVEFSNTDFPQLIDISLMANPKHYPHYLNTLKGNCVMCEGDYISKCRIAYTPYQDELIEKINEKYSDFKTKEALIIGKEKRNINSYELGKNICPATLPADRMSGFAANVGNTLFDTPVNVCLNNQDSSMLIIGDTKRSLSLEFSLIQAFHAHNPNSQINILNFGTTLSNGFTDSLPHTAEISSTDGDLYRQLSQLYSEYKDRAKRYRRYSLSQNEFDPILTVIHDCNEYSEIIHSAKEQYTPHTESQEDITSSSIDATVSAPMPDIDNDIDASLSEIDTKKASVPISENIGDIDTKKASVPISENIGFGDMPAYRALCELFENCGKYNMHFIVQISTDNKRANQIEKFKDIFQDRLLSELFNTALVVPAIFENHNQIETERGKLNAIFEVLDMNDSILTRINKVRNMKEQELYRCYHTIGKEYYTQLIPYEWSDKI